MDIDIRLQAKAKPVQDENPKKKLSSYRICFIPATSSLQLWPCSYYRNPNLALQEILL